jgi:hypothetical protein
VPNFLHVHERDVHEAQSTVQSNRNIMPVTFDSFSAQAGKTYRRKLRSNVHRSNKSQMQSLICNQADLSALANKRQRGSMLRCDCPLA